MEYSQKDIRFALQFGKSTGKKCFSHLPFTYSLVGTKKLGLFEIGPDMGTHFGERFTHFFPYNIGKAIEYELKITSLLGTGTVIHPGTCTRYY